jgi:RNA 3'-terminal phosphate cyclase (ATP)
VAEPLHIDGSHGEGGGQILRTALGLAAITGREVRIENVRAGRSRPGLAAQHLTALRAIAELCDARLAGDELGSREVLFMPGGSIRPGDYVFDVGDARQGGSAGAATLVLQTLLVPLALAGGASSLSIRGGTHVTQSPSFDYARDVWLVALRRMGVSAELELAEWGWFPIGRGEIRARIRGRPGPLVGLDLDQPGELVRVQGRAVAANLPSHIPQRMADRARGLLAKAGIASRIEPLRVRAACPGAGLFLSAEYEQVCGGFSALGERGKASEAVAEEAVAALLAHRTSGAGLEAHLADQLLVPLALAEGRSRVSVEEVSSHLSTSAWVIERFGLARVRIGASSSPPHRVIVEPAALDEPYAQQRLDMVRLQLESRDISDERVLEAMRKVPRHRFVPEDLRGRAHEDRPLPIGHGQTISQPYIVALMTQLALRVPARRALDIGTGSGYQAAVLAELVDEVYSMEYIPELAARAGERLEHLDYTDVSLRCGDAHEGWPEAAPFDVIIVACAPRDVPEVLIEQLAPGGRLVIPTGTTSQDLVLVEKQPDGSVCRSSEGGVAFVPMVGGPARRASWLPRRRE